jgi:tetratricopeptide (TPR) repeat protein
VESVAWISGRKDVLSLVLVLLAHLAYRRARETGRGRWVAPLLLLLGGLTKGTVWLWAGVFALDEAIHAFRTGRRWPPGAAARLLPSALVAVAGIVLDAVVAARHGPGAVEHGVSTLSLAFAMAGVHAAYALHVLAPARLSLDYAVDPAGSLASPMAWLGLVLAALAVVLFVHAWRRRRPLALLALGLWILGLGPVNNVVPTTSLLMADRYLYVPAAGAYLLLAAALVRAGPARGWLLGSAAALLAVLCVQRTGVFASSGAVWADATEKVPGSALAWFQRGQAAAAEGDYANALAFAERAIALEPRPEIRVRAHLLETDARQAALARRVGRGEALPEGDVQALLDAARRAVTLARRIGSLPGVRGDPREIQADAEVALGHALRAAGERAAGRAAFERAQVLHDAHFASRYNLGTVLAESGSAEDLARAREHLEVALHLEPASLEAALQLGNVQALSGDAAGALETLRRAEARHGRTPEVLFGLAQVHLASGRDVARAEGLLAELRRQDPSHPKAARLLADIHLAHGRILLERGRQEGDERLLDDAVLRFDQALAADPRRFEADVEAGDALLERSRYADARRRYRAALGRAGERPWVARLVARAAILEAAWAARLEAGEEGLPKVAEHVRTALELPVPRIDLGFVPLEEELPALRAALAEAADGAPAAPLARRVLRAAAHAATGATQAALADARTVLRRTDAVPPAVLDAALWVRAAVRHHLGQGEDARQDYALLAERRPTDPLPRVRLLQLDLQAARVAVSVAEAGASEPAAVEAARAQVARAVAAVRDFADRHPTLGAAALLGAEADMQEGLWIEALRRLNALAAAHPDEPAVHRGMSLVYQREYAATQERTLLRQAVREIEAARALDPRDPRTVEGAANVALLAGDPASALAHVARARSYELVEEGPAARRLADLHVALGRRALEQGDGEGAGKAVKAAKAASPGSAAPWLLEGDLLFGAQKYPEAVEAYRTALELEPGHPQVFRALARLHRKRALAFRVKSLSVPDSAADAESLRAAYRRQELEELDRAVRYDPGAEEAEAARVRIAELRDTDPEVQRAAHQAAEALYAQGTAHLEARRLSDALSSFRAALERFPDHLPAHVRLAETVHRLLDVPGPRTAEEERMEARWLGEAFESLHAADALDPKGLFVARHLVRGRLDEWVWTRDPKRPEARLAALTAYRRAIDALEARDPEDPGLAEARRRAERLEAAGR